MRFKIVLIPEVNKPDWSAYGGDFCILDEDRKILARSEKKDDLVLLLNKLNEEFNK